MVFEARERLLALQLHDKGNSAQDLEQATEILSLFKMWSRICPRAISGPDITLTIAKVEDLVGATEDTSGRN